MTALAALLGAVVGGAAVLAVAAARGDRPRVAGRRWRWPQRSGVRLGGAAAAGLAVAAVTRWPVAALAAGAAGFIAPSLLAARGQHAEAVARIEAVAGWAEMLRDVLAAAGGLEQAVVVTAPLAPPAIRPAVVRLAGRLDREHLAPALRAFADDLDDPTGDLVVAALVLAAERSPRRLGELLGDLAATARAEVSMRLRVETSRARTRTSVWIISGFTGMFSAGLVLFARPYLSAYDDPLGQAVLALVVACYGAAYAWLGRATRANRPQRMLTAEVAR